MILSYSCDNKKIDYCKSNIILLNEYGHENLYLFQNKKDAINFFVKQGLMLHDTLIPNTDPDYILGKAVYSDNKLYAIFYTDEFHDSSTIQGIEFYLDCFKILNYRIGDTIILNKKTDTIIGWMPSRFILLSDSKPRYPLYYDMFNSTYIYRIMETDRFYINELNHIEISISMNKLDDSKFKIWSINFGINKIERVR
ncbi:MAG: hypothetical protein AB1304_10695 [Bacteroidota bacterium]